MTQEVEQSICGKNRIILEERNEDRSRSLMVQYCRCRLKAPSPSRAAPGCPLRRMFRHTEWEGETLNTAQSHYCQVKASLCL